jgi:hypothetical protein
VSEPDEDRFADMIIRKMAEHGTVRQAASNEDTSLPDALWWTIGWKGKVVQSSSRIDALMGLLSDIVDGEAERQRLLSSKEK